MKKIFQVLMFSFIIAAGVHGIEKSDCKNVTGQLEDNRLKMVYLNPVGELLDATVDPAVTTHCSEMSTDKRDAVRIDEHKYVLLGYDEPGYHLQKIRIVECGDGKKNEYPEHIFTPKIEIKKEEWNSKAYFNKDGSDDGYIYISEEERIDLKDFEKKTYALSDVEEKLRNCFEEASRCIYDPYTKEVEVRASSMFSSSCSLSVVKEDPAPKAKSEVKDISNDKFCLSDDEKYQKIFLIPDADEYPRGKCKETKLRSKTKDEQTDPPESHEGLNKGPGGQQFDLSKNDGECEESTMLWGIFGGLVGLFFIVLAGAIVMVVIERKGKAKKQSYMRLQKMLKKDEPSNTTMTQTQTQTQDDGGRTQDDNTKSAFSNPQQ